MPQAIEAVGRMLNAWPNASKSAPNSYIGTIAALLCQYPRSIAERCADPLRGVARATKFLPTVADVVAWCEPEAESMSHRAESERRTEQQLRERDQHNALPPHNPDVLERVRQAMAAAGMPILEDRARVILSKPAPPWDGTVTPQLAEIIRRQTAARVAPRDAAG